jgi:hypothetical protein
VSLDSKTKATLKLTFSISQRILSGYACCSAGNSNTTECRGPRPLRSCFCLFMEILITSRTARYANAKERQIAGRVLESSSKSAHTIIPLPASLPSVQTSAEILRGLARRNTRSHIATWADLFLCVLSARVVLPAT